MSDDFPPKPADPGRNPDTMAVPLPDDGPAFLLALSDAMRAQSDPAAVVATAARMLANRLDALRVVFSEVDGVLSGWCADDGGTGTGTGGLSALADPIMQDLRFGRIVQAVMDDNAASARPDLAALFRQGARALLAVPVRVQGRLVAHLTVLGHDLCPWPDAQIRLVQEVAGRLWADIMRARTDAALRDSEQKFRTLFDSIDEGFCVLDIIDDPRGGPLDYRFVEVNKAFELHTGLSGIEGKRRSEVSPGLEAPWIEHYAEIVRTGRARRFESHHNDTGRWYDVYATPVGAPDSRQVCVVFQDTTERREREEWQAFLLRLSDALRVEPDADRVADRAMGMLTDQLRLDRCFIAAYRLAEDRADIIHQIARGDAAPLPVQVRLSHFQASFREAMTKTLVIDDSHDSEGLSPAEQAFRRDLGLRAAVASTVRAGPGRPLWSMVASTARPRRWSPGEVALVEEAAERTWAAMERVRADSALRHSEARLRAAFSISTVGMLFWRRDGRLNDVNEAFLAMSGFEREDVLGKSWRELTPPDFHDASARFVQEVETTGEGKPYEKQYLRRDGTRWWGLFTARKLDDGYVEFVLDITHRHEAQAALREREDLFSQFGQASQDVLWIRDAETLRWTYLTPAFETIYGIDRSRALSGNNYRNWLDLVLPADRKAANARIRQVRAGEHVTFEYRIRRPLDGQIRWLRNTDFPITDTAGKVVMIGGVGHDITEAKLAEQRLEQSEERLRSAVEVGRLGLWDWNVQTNRVHWSDEHFRMEGYRVGEVEPSYEAWAARLHPDDKEATEQALRHSMETHQEYGREFRVMHPDGSVRWLHGRGRFQYDDAGRPVRMIGAMIDTTQRREWEDRQKLLVAELQHRTRNLMSVVRALAERTGSTSVSLADFQDRFGKRLDALARVQGLLSRLNDHDRVTFDELIRSELSAMPATADRVTLEGPAGVRLRSSTVQTLALVLHELATNAVKYGALGQPAARLDITWRLEPPEAQGKPWLHVLWRESGVSMPAEDQIGRGQGRELIEQALPYQMKARVRFDLGPDGIRCAISFPVSGTSGSALRA